MGALVIPCSRQDPGQVRFGMTISATTSPHPERDLCAAGVDVIRVDSWPLLGIEHAFPVQSVDLF